MATKKTTKKGTRYRFAQGVSVDAQGDEPERRFEAGSVVAAEDLPARVDVKRLVKDGVLVEDKD